MNNLKILQELVDELKTTSSSNEKKAILSKYNNDLIKKFLYYVNYDQYQFNITSKNLINRDDLYESVYTDVFDMLDDLRLRNVTGHKALSVVNGFIKDNEEYKDLIYSIIDKNLKTRTDSKLINKVFEGLIPSFEVALASKYEDYADKIDFKKQTFYSSRKLDGCRCLVIKEQKCVTAYSRSGKEFFTLGRVLEAFDDESIPNGVYDGEICLVDDKGDEIFSDIMKEIRKKDHTIEKPRFKMFDYISLDNFYSGTSSMKFGDRYSRLVNIFKKMKTDDTVAKNLLFGFSPLDVVKQIKIRDLDHFLELSQEATDNGWEGIIIREDWAYEGKRSKRLLKVKKFFDAEFVVIDTYPTVKRMLYDGIEKEMDCMGGVNIEYKGYTVGCGSGWSDSERLEFHKNPEKIIGKTICVQWFEETTNEKGTLSLRFPTKKWIYDNGRDV